MNKRNSLITAILFVSLIAGTGAASAASYTVQGNDTMWKISQKQQISLYELIRLNPQVRNPNIIWPGLRLNVPDRYPIGQPATGTPQQPGAGQQPVTGGGQQTQGTFAQQVVTLVNQERAKAGLRPLAVDNAVAAVALDKAKDMHNNRYFSHTSPTFGSPFDMMTDYGIRYTYAGENIAMGQRTPQEVMNGWMNSPGHRQNILSPNFTKIGVGYYNNYWVQMFIAN